MGGKGIARKENRERKEPTCVKVTKTEDRKQKTEHANC